MKVLIGKKLGMTKMFATDGQAVGVTAVEVWPATVLRVRETDKDGYEAIQIGAGVAKRRGKAVLGQTGGTPYQVVKEFSKTAADVSPGVKLAVDQLETGERVAVTAVSKGKGFQGTVKRHNFSRGPKTHGSKNYREPGSIAGTGAARVFPGQKMPGRMGNEAVTTKNLRVAAVHAEDNIVLLAGSVPGPTGQVVTITSSAEAGAKPEPAAEPAKPQAKPEPKAEKPEAKTDKPESKEDQKADKPKAEAAS